MYCTNCGHRLEDTANFCPNCGRSRNAKAKRKANPRVFLVVGVITAVLIVTLFLRKQGTDLFSSLKEMTTKEPTHAVTKPNPVEGELCISCSGSGKCIACEGDGNCFYCDGTGLQDCILCWKSDICFSCQGSGEDCDFCQGTGHCDESIDGKKDCHSCFGSGTCAYCKDSGDGVCATCQGMGTYIPEENPTVYSKVNCGNADCENGILYCFFCDGTTCGFCNGTGKGLCLFGDCDECEDGYIGTCDSCGGSGECRYCHGAYTLNCPDCQDGVLIETIS